MAAFDVLEERVEFSRLRAAYCLGIGNPLHPACLVPSLTQVVLLQELSCSESLRS